VKENGNERTVTGIRELLSPDNYIYKATTEVDSGTDMKASVVVPASRYIVSLHPSRYPAVIKVCTEEKGHSNGSIFEITALKSAGVTSPPNSTPAVRVDHQIIGIDDQLLHVQV